MAEATRPNELAELVADPETVSAATSLLAEKPAQRPVYVPLFDPYVAEPTIEAEATIAHGWNAQQMEGRIPLRPPIAWGSAAGDHRSRVLNLYFWEPMAAPLAAYASTGVVEYLRWCIDLAIDWASQHPSLAGESEYDWYDMAVGLRAARLAYIVPAGVHAGILTQPELHLLLACARLHLRALEPDESFSAHSNHGIYQAAGQLAVAAAFPLLPEADRARALGTERLRQLIEHHFDAQGAHHEHSPGYHLMVLRSLLALRALALIADPSLLERLAAAEDAMSWFVAPVGTVPTVGDSDRLPRERVAADGNLKHPALRFALTEGREGAPPDTPFGLFDLAGYVVARDRWAQDEGFRRSSYLLQSCGFHSRVHKHADDLSFVWYARGIDLLADPGRFGYPGRMDPESPLGKLGFYYDDPRRIYVESTRAHNCLEIDRTSYPRRGVPFYGSAIRAAARDERSGVVCTESSVTHFGTVEHTRLLFHLPGEWTVVVDHASDADGGGHDYCQRFQFGPELELLDHGPRSLSLRIPTSGEWLDVTRLGGGEALPPVRGQTEPELQGFVSRAAGEMIPSWSAGWRIGGGPSATLAALLVIVPEGGRPEASAELDHDGSRGELRWSVAAADRALRWWRDADGRLVHSYEQTA